GARHLTALLRALALVRALRVGAARPAQAQRAARRAEPPHVGGAGRGARARVALRRLGHDGARPRAMNLQVAVSNDVYPATFGLSSRVWGLARAMARTERVRLTCAVGSSSKALAREQVENVDIRRVRTGHPTAFYYLQKLG